MCIFHTELCRNRCLFATDIQYTRMEKGNTAYRIGLVIMKLTTVINFIALLLLSLPGISHAQTEEEITEATPSKSEYFSWINNTNEGPTEAQTLINLEFFNWLKREYGMELDIYAFDAGTIDGKRWYGSTTSSQFKSQFPNHFNHVYKVAKKNNTRLGVWGGPDGFGDTELSTQKRIEQMVALCRDYNFALFKFDSVAGQLRDEKQSAFAEMMTQCRKFSPDLILLNHRLNLGKVGTPHATTFLWEGLETYIDVHMWNKTPAIHNRAGALSRGLSPNLSRLTEDHGVCLSNALDYWDDELILQAFNRALILSPQIYCNPWFLRDDEYSKLARIFNLARKYRNILVAGKVLPEKRYGPYAVSRGDSETRLITLRNLGWLPKTHRLALNNELGIEKTPQDSKFEVRQYHPTEKILGTYDYGSSVDVTLAPFRSALIRVTSKPDWGIEGYEYEVIKDIKGQDLEINILSDLSVHDKIKASMVKTDREETNIKFALPTHRKLGDLKPISMPEDASSLYEATVFSANNNALEVQAVARSGVSKIAEVQAARKAFFEQEAFVDRGLWDKYLFDGDNSTKFYRSQRWLYNWNIDPDSTVMGGAFRLDLGRVERLDEIILETTDIQTLQPLKLREGIIAQVSTDLRSWTDISFLADKKMVLKMPRSGYLVRYLRLAEAPLSLNEVNAIYKGKALERNLWTASNLFGDYSAMNFIHAWSTEFSLAEIAPDSYLTIAVPGHTGNEGVYATLRVNGRLIGAPRRSPSYPANSWELQVRPVDGNYSYYIPLQPKWAGAKFEIVLLGREAAKAIKPEVWISRRPIPLSRKPMIIKR